jgi:hypothetical protein
MTTVPRCRRLGPETRFSKSENFYQSAWSLWPIWLCYVRLIQVTLVQVRLGNFDPFSAKQLGPILEEETGSQSKIVSGPRQRALLKNAIHRHLSIL